MNLDDKDLEKYWTTKAGEMAIQFKKDLEDSANDFPQDKRVELYEHLLQCFELGAASISEEGETIWNKYLDLEASFLKKQGSRLKKYITKNFAIYYGDDSAILKKNLVSQEEWEKLPPKKKTMPLKQLLLSMEICKGILRSRIANHWLNESPEDEKKGKSDSTHPLADSALKASLKTEEKRRKAKDRATKLSEEQTVLLIHCLKEMGLILTDENLSNKDAGLAFGILSGYSHETIRQDLGRIENLQNYENLNVLISHILRLKNYLEVNLTEAKKKTKKS